ncbi:methylated-DNA--[protein]-cysteine S-methyltransferase [Rhodopirellula sallentina]|uniref:methylated-DNA--[protein]-cysteine S-methyltransferase n=1 Tax=Rhodopirellula sallentina SM41 TaxID=1263870 RepID=M5UKD6_9BACT|nr:methylated-DNA--[protein]-cysteine S-methyltransferase [Rhodopirellula sallentina]EMI58316.1 methylated-DNA-(protein)-cysteine S-methyltransferase [Rhodopirellula sallentina SM41]
MSLTCPSSVQWIQTEWESPVGGLRISVIIDPSGDVRCAGLYFREHHPVPAQWRVDVDRVDWQDCESTKSLVEELQSYFAGGQRVFETRCSFTGTEFQNNVWRALQAIPFGQTRTYSEIAEIVGRPGSVRAVGTAIGRNPISIIVPCHRVVARSGVLAGFAGGLERKRFLLDHEATVSGQARLFF